MMQKLIFRTFFIIIIYGTERNFSGFCYILWPLAQFIKLDQLYMLQFLDKHWKLVYWWCKS